MWHSLEFGFFASIAGMIGIAMVQAVSHYGWRGIWNMPRDATDTKDKRLGFIVLTDHGTGVQYLMTTLGGVTPRLDRYGKPMRVPND